MSKVNTFFHVYINSLLPQEPYYKKLTKTKFRFSLVYFIALSYASFYIFGILFLAKTGLFYEMRSRVAAVSQSFSTFPSDLTISVHEGHATSTYARPYFMWMDLHGNKDLLFVFDESDTSTAKESGSLIYMNSHSFTINRGNEQRTIELPADRDFTINKDVLTSVAHAVSIISNLSIIAIVLVGLVLMPIGVTLITLFYAFVVSMVTFLLWTLFHGSKPVPGLGFQKTLQFSFHAVGFPLLAMYLLILSQAQIHRFGYLFFMIFFIFLNGALYEGFIAAPHKVPTHHKTTSKKKTK